MGLIKMVGRLNPRRVGDALVLLAVSIGAAVVWRYSPANEWAVGALAYAWVPVVLWTGAAALTLRFQRRFLLPFWRWWGLAAGAAAAVTGILSLIHPQFGLMAEVSLGGRWGGVIGGSPLALAVLKISAIVILTPLAMFPRHIGIFYGRVLSQAGLGLRATGVQGYRAALGMRRYFAGLRKSAAPPAVLAEKGSWEGHQAEREGATQDEQGIWDGNEAGKVPDLVSSVGEKPEGAPRPLAGADPAGKPGSTWQLPPIELLSAGERRQSLGTALDKMARLVESTLGEHGVSVEVKDIKAGPRIVRFGLVPGWTGRQGEEGAGETGRVRGESSRVKVQSILTREKDLALALKTPYLRLEAPVPGEALVGLEVPSPSPAKVTLREVMESPPFTQLVAKGGLPIALGQDTGGSPVVMDLATLPHLLIAGSTGSGKSVCINSVVASMLLTKPPDQLRLMMVDPKRVELTPFNGIPHLITPVIVDVDEVNSALRALMREMMRRYRQMEEVGARNIAGYNAKSKDPMPFLVLIVDELADLMMSGGFQVEQNLIRLAQLGRATGIHLVLATQRPSVTVVTGLLKANIVARVAFAVASQVDSRVILDMVGAEKLLGKGDMLLLSNDSPKPRRVQGTLVNDPEIDRLVEFWVAQQGPPVPEISMIDDDDGDLDQEDDLDEDLLDQARDLAVSNPHLSSSFLERRLKVGGRRAGQIIEQLEDEGLVSLR
ncbi:MAG: DNA translocase FtsK [Chloroflexi bacterium]|nr:DNA translocase FtsK [Chloroflexota bacterium]